MRTQLPYEILAAGHFAPGEVHISWRDELRPTTPALDAAIAEEWERRSAEAKEKNQILFNGGMARYLAHRLNGERLEIEAGPTDYRDFVGTNLYNGRRVNEWSWERFSNPIGTTGTIFSTDGMIVFGRRSARVAFHGGYLHTIGGALETDEVRADGTIDAFASTRRELHEELGLSQADITEMQCVGLIRDFQIHQPELLFEVRVSLSAEQLQARHTRADVEQEHLGLEWTPDDPGALVGFIHQAAPVAPVAIGALMLHGKLTWGEEWYGQASEELLSG
jgi:8-oxo-dGTP pyrophosphatase MutT (NUDIX family)